MKELINKKWIKKSLYVLLGAIGGFAFYYFIGCNTGTCPITSSPYISTSYGAIMGLFLSFDGKKEKEKENISN